MRRQFNRLTVEPPLELVPSGSGYHLRDARKRELWAKITRKCVLSSGSGSESGSESGSGSEEFSTFSGFCSGSGPGYDSSLGHCKRCAYEWQEVQEDGECDTEELAAHGTWCSFPAFEISGRSDVAVGAIVRLIPSRIGPWYVFSPGGSGTSTTNSSFEFAYILDDSPHEVEDGNVYWNACLPQWDDGEQDWEDPDEAELVWVVTRINEPLNTGDLLPVTFVGSFDPTEGGNDTRFVYAGIKSRLTDVLIVESNDPIEADGNLYWPCHVQYWDNSTQERKQGREVWVIDWLGEQLALRAGDKIIAHWIGDASPGAWDDTFSGNSGSSDQTSGLGSTQQDRRRPLYATFCSGINTRFLKCFENNVLARNGTIVNSGTRISFLDEDCVEATEFEGICTDA